MQILGGGFNLLPPGDKVPITDYLIAQNFRVDREGALWNRNGYINSPDSPIAGVNWFHTAALLGTDFYYAANTAYNQGALFYRDSGLWNISTGRPGLVGLNGWMWIMDSAAQLRHNAVDGLQQWALQPPLTPCVASPGANDANGPNGTYTIYVTFASADGELETNPGPTAAPVSRFSGGVGFGGSGGVGRTPPHPQAQVTVAQQDINLTQIPTSPDPRLQVRNIYAIGGTLAQAYRVAQIDDNVSTTFTLTFSDLAATNAGIVMPTTNDPPPAGNGMVLYMSRLIAWSGSRLFWTDPNLPQYWPGSANNAVGNWVDIGADGEDIVWCTAHANVLIIYKQRSVWRKVGDIADPVAGAIEPMDGAPGLVNPWAVDIAAQGDFYVGPNGLYHNNLDQVQPIATPLGPLFNANLTHNGNLTQPGRILPSTALVGNGNYDISVGFALGKLYLAYNEQGEANHPALMVWDGTRWMYHRSTAYTGRIHGFFFDGRAMWALTGQPGVQGLIYNIDDFTLCYPSEGGVGWPIDCVYQSHFEDCGLPDDPKVWLEAAIDADIPAPDTATIYAAFANGTLAQIGTIIGGAGRQTVSFSLSETEAKNCSIAILCSIQGPLKIHNVYLFYYVEARLAVSAATIPIDLGNGKPVQVKELLLDIDASQGAATATLSSDLPGNVMATRETITIPQSGGRGLLKFPFAHQDGFLWQLAIAGGPFRLYSAKLLARPIGTYVEAYEAAAGFIWDSMEMTFESLLTKIPRVYGIALAATPIKQFREISLEVDTFGGNVELQFITDLPGDAQAVRFTAVFNTGNVGRRFIRIPLPAGTLTPIEGRLCRIQLSGTSKFILYEMSVELLAIGVYVEAGEAQAGAVWDSRPFDMGTSKAKEARELELDLDGSVTASLYADLPAPFTMRPVWQQTVTSSGRQRIPIPLTSFPVGRMFQLILTSSSAFKLYNARIRVRELGMYLTGDEASGGAIWDSTPLDFDQAVKTFKRMRIDYQADPYDGHDPAVLNVLTDHFQNVMSQQFSFTLPTYGLRQTLMVPLPPALDGRLFQAQIRGTGVRIFGVFLYAKAENDGKANWAWVKLPLPETAPDFGWLPFLINPTPPGAAADPSQWLWAKVLSVAETPDTWTVIDVPFDVSNG